jgi:hypothetical protein
MICRDCFHFERYGKQIEVVRISGSGTLPGLLKFIREHLMAGRGIIHETDDWAVINGITEVADRMGGSVTINLATDGALRGIEALPAPEPSQAQIAFSRHRAASQRQLRGAGL